MASQTSFPTTFGEAAFGLASWVNPTNMYANDSTYATGTNAGSGVNGFAVGGFTFTIPTGATIDGIVLTVRGMATSSFSSIIDRAALGFTGVANGGPNNNQWGYLQGGIWYYSTSNSDITVGGSTNLWQTTGVTDWNFWTPGLINNPKFAAFIYSQVSGTVSIDSVSLTVYYTGGTSGTEITEQLAYPQNSSQWTCPTGVTNVTKTQCWAGGGGGALGANSTGGGGGAYSEKANISVTPSTVYSFQQGGGGSYSDGTTGRAYDGTDTWFIDTSTVLAKGGIGGYDSGSFHTAAGGAAGSGVGDTTYSGGSTDVGPSGGGGGAGSGGSGSNSTSSGGAAGAGVGGGAGGDFTTTGFAYGRYFGGGGGGQDTQTFNANGGPGLLLITYDTPSTAIKQLMMMGIGN